MEPSPGLDYNSFRSWRKANGVTSTREELSTAWAAYSEPTKSISSRSSPKRSPLPEISNRIRALGTPVHQATLRLQEKPPQTGRSYLTRSRSRTSPRRKRNEWDEDTPKQHIDVCLKPISALMMKRALDAGIVWLPIGISQGWNAFIFTDDGQWEITVKSTYETKKQWEEFKMVLKTEQITIQQFLRSVQRIDYLALQGIDYLTQKRILQHKADCNARLGNYATKQTTTMLLKECNKTLSQCLVSSRTDIGFREDAQEKHERVLDLVIHGRTEKLRGEYTIRLASSRRDVELQHSVLLHLIEFVAWATADYAYVQQVTKLLANIELLSITEVVRMMEDVLVSSVVRLHELYSVLMTR